MNFDPHPSKGGETGMNALGALHQAVGTPSIAFGTRSPEQPTPSGTRFMLAPDQARIAREIYNTSSVYLQPSLREGFGMCAVEAMACGCALVSTDNGGSVDYALDGETALVCGNDEEEMFESMRRLVRDDDLRTRIATNGAAFVRRFRWSVSADRFERLAFDHVKS
jgi:glycosyltransferase involved in cell wall biosynthesis